VPSVTNSEPFSIFDSRFVIRRLILAFFICLAFSTVGMSFQALLVKLTAIHFASVRSFYTWDLYEWFLVGGFLNQLAGVCFVEEMELHRILLFKFGGTGAQWDWKKCRACTGYLALLSKKITTGWIADKRHSSTPRLSALAVIATIDSLSIQMLLLSPEREIHLEKTRREDQTDSKSERHEMFESLFDRRQGEYEKLLSDDSPENPLEQDPDKLQEFAAVAISNFHRMQEKVRQDRRPHKHLLDAQLQAHIDDLGQTSL